MTERRKRNDDWWYRYRLKCTNLAGLQAQYMVECSRDVSVLDSPQVAELRKKFVLIQAVSREVVWPLGHELDSDFVGWCM